MSSLKLLFPLILLAASVGQATPLRLDYTKSWSSNGVVYYTFTMALENADNSWIPGQEFGWVIFGDSPSLGGSPFSDFTLGMSTGPWSELTTASGDHNGFQFGGDGLSWVPSYAGSFLIWHGSSTTNVADGSLFFSADGGTNFVAATNIFPDADFPDSPAFVPAVVPSQVLPEDPGTVPFQLQGPPDPPMPVYTVQLVATPEPATFGLVGLLLVGLGLRRRS